MENLRSGPPSAKTFFFFFFSAEKWHELPHFPNPNKWGYAMVSLNNDVYVTGQFGTTCYNKRKTPVKR